MKELKNNVNTLLWLMVTLSVMVVFLTLSSCNSSVNPDQTKTITITYGCSDNNGTIEARVISSKEGKIEGNKIINLVSGDKIQFTAKPNNGYKFKEWIPKQLDNKETFELTVDKNLSVSVEFEKDENPPGPNEKEPLTLKILEEELSVKETDLIVSSYTGLGLKKEGKQFLYRYKKYGSDEKVNCSGKQLIKLMQDANVTVVEDEVPGLDKNLSDELKDYSLGRVLETKWNFAKNSEKIVPKEFRTFTFNDAAGRNERPSVVGLYELLSSDYYVSYKNGEVYLEVALSNTDYFADWTIAFVKKSESHEVYVFSVGEIESKSETDMKIKPYILRNVRTGKVKNYKYLPDLEVLSAKKLVPDLETHHGMKLCHTYRFSLSSLLKDYLKQVSILENWDGKYKYSDPDKSDNKDKCISDLSEKFIAGMLNPTDYDIYMIIGAYRDPNGEIYSTRDNFRECWRNVLKLTDSKFWGECFTN